MTLVNVRKNSLDETPSCLMAIKSDSVLMLEHPLNHSKRLGVIRLKNTSLEVAETIEQVQEQLIIWQSDENVIGIWFENDKAPLTLANTSHGNEQLDEAHQLKLSDLMRQINLYPKVCMFWCDQVYPGTMSLLFDVVNFLLVHDSSGYQSVDNQTLNSASTGQLKAIPFAREQGGFSQLFPIVCYRNRLLELLSSHPWHSQSCRVSKQHFSRLFEESLTLRD